MRPQVVSHLAAQIDVRHSVERPADDAQTDIPGTIAVLEAAVRRVTGWMWPGSPPPTCSRPGSDLTGPVNIGHGQETSVLDLLEALQEVSPDRPLPDPVFASERPGEVRRSCLDVSRARDELGWEATVSLRDGLRTILAGL